jgi:hypothetical protein
MSCPKTATCPQVLKLIAGQMLTSLIIHIRIFGYIKVFVDQNNILPKDRYRPTINHDCINQLRLLVVNAKQ